MHSSIADNMDNTSVALSARIDRMQAPAKICGDESKERGLREEV
jgi:hypothetical protein